MRRLVVVFALYIAFPLLALAQHEHGQTGHDNMKMGGGPMMAAPAPSTPAPGSMLKQTTCPVTGDPIKSDSSTVYQGKRVFFCCDDCIDKFKQAPAKYLPALYKQIYQQQVQVKCPVMGGAIDPKVSAEYKGQQIYFCCPGCDKKFTSDPAKYEAKLKNSFTQQVHCPVTGNPIDPAQKLEEKDRTVYFDSKESATKYKSDPAKYAKALLPEVGVVAYGPVAKDDIVTCRVCPAGKAQHPRGETQPVVYQGKVYLLFSEACAKAFKADPGKYARALNNAAEPKSQVPARAQSAVVPSPNFLPGNGDDTGHTQHQTAAGHEGHGGGPGCCQ
jgi:YHS domain-containing protein